jgi:hypothetical protein
MSSIDPHHRFAPVHCLRPAFSGPPGTEPCLRQVPCRRASIRHSPIGIRIPGYDKKAHSENEIPGRRICPQDPVLTGEGCPAAGFLRPGARRSGAASSKTTEREGIQPVRIACKGHIPLKPHSAKLHKTYPGHPIAGRPSGKRSPEQRKGRLHTGKAVTAFRHARNNT